MILYVFEDFVFENANFMAWMEFISKYANEYRISVNKKTYDLLPEHEKEKAYYFNEDIEKKKVAIYKKNDLQDYLNKELEDYYNGIVTNEKFLGVIILSPLKTPEVVKVCEKKELSYMNIELAPFRYDLYKCDNYTVFQKDPIIYTDRNKVCDMYEEFKKNKNDFGLKQTLNGMQIVLMFVGKSELERMLHLFLLEKEEYEYGFLALLNLYSNSDLCTKGFSNEKIIREISLKKGELLVRKNFRDLNSELYKDRNYTIDDSRNAIEFILKCKNIVVTTSKSSLEAILCGKKVFSPRNSFAWDSLSNIEENNEVVYNDEFLNFIIFYFIVPLRVVMDENYFKWRVENNPSVIEVCNYHLKYICDNILNCSVSDLNDDYWEVISRKNDIAPDFRNDKLKLLEKITQYQWNQKKIYICGLGVDSERIANIFISLGAEIQSYLVSVKKKDIGSKKNISCFSEIKVHDEDIFVVTQRSIKSQFEVINNLKKIGVKEENIVVF